LSSNGPGIVENNIVGIDQHLNRSHLLCLDGFRKSGEDKPSSHLLVDGRFILLVSNKSEIEIEA
jgi:hypothetical protein